MRFQELLKLRPNSEIFITENPTIRQLVNVIKEVIIASSKSREIINVSERLKASGNVLKTVFDFAYNSIVYKPDPDNIQNIKLGPRILRNGAGNCVDYTVLISSVLLNLGISHKLRVVDFGEGFEHIYVVVGNIVLDCVLGQPQDGTATRSNRLDGGRFGDELSYYKKRDYYMRVNVLSGANYIGSALPVQRVVDRLKTALNVVSGSNNYGKDIYCLTCSKSAVKQFDDDIKRVRKYLTVADVSEIKGLLTTLCNKIDYKMAAFSFRITPVGRRGNCNEFVNKKVADYQKWAEANERRSLPKTSTFTPGVVGLSPGLATPGLVSAQQPTTDPVENVSKSSFVIPLLLLGGIYAVKNLS